MRRPLEQRSQRPQMNACHASFGHQLLVGIDPASRRDGALRCPLNGNCQSQAWGHLLARKAGDDARVNADDGSESALRHADGGKVFCKFGHARMMHHMHQTVKGLDAPSAFARAMHNMHAVGMNLARIRKARGLSQRDLADMVGLDQATIQRAEAMHSSAKLETYQKCADALGVTLEDLFVADREVDRDAAEEVLVQKFRQVPKERRPNVFALLDLVRQPDPS